MLEYVMIRDGSARYEIRTAAVDEWPIVNWKAAMRRMVHGGWLNDGAVDELAAWFPEAIRAASADLKEAQAAYDSGYRPLKEVPKEDREKQKNLNRELFVAAREARTKTEKLKARYLEFLAAKALMKKEN